MFDVLNRSNLLRAAVVALGTAVALPALAETDFIPLGGNGRGALSAWSGPSAPATTAVGPVISVEPGSIGDLRGASGSYAGRTPLARGEAGAFDATANLNLGAN